MLHTAVSTNILRTLAYRRVSTAEQEKGGTSLEAQTEAITAYCRTHGLPDVVKALDFDETESGGEESEHKRDEVHRLLATVRHGDMVIVQDVDRFSRDIVFTVQRVRAIMRKSAVFVAIKQGFDSRAPNAEDTLGQWAWLADMERRRIKARTEYPRRLLRSQGFFVEGQPPFGYKRAPRSDKRKPDRRLLIDEAKAPIVREMFTLAANGTSAEKMSDHLRAKYPGIGAFGATWVLMVLRNRIYTGQLARTSVRPKRHTRAEQLPAEWVDAHEPIIDKELFSRVQTALVSRRSPGRRPSAESQTAQFLLRGLAKCAYCGASMSAIAPQHRKRQHTGHYVCRRHREGRTEDQRCPKARYLRADTIESNARGFVLEWLSSLTKTLTRPPRKVEAPDFVAMRREIASKRQRVINLVADGVMSREEITEKVSELNHELAQIDAMEHDFGLTCSKDTVEARKAARAYALDVLDQWDALTVDVRRALLRFLAKAIVADERDGVRITWHEPSEIAAATAIGTAVPQLRAEALPALPPATKSLVSELLEQTAQIQVAIRT
jgi:DNA invertase Pin-like site-specific DNA recombinase